MKQDFTAHNEMVAEVWRSFNAGDPIRVPMTLGINPRFYLLDAKLNTKGITFEQYTKDMDCMADIQLKYQHYLAHNVPRDVPMGNPGEEEGWSLYVDTQNVYEAAWLGCPVIFYADNCPSTHPILTDDKRNMLFDRGIPDPFEGYLAQHRNRHEYLLEKVEKGMAWDGVPVKNVRPTLLGSDGPMTVACNLRGTTQFCMDLYDDPDYAEALLDYITQATILRIKAWRRYYGMDELSPGVGIADDSIALLSSRDYQRFIAPRHKRIFQALSADPTAPNSIHLCGDATRHFKYLIDEMNVHTFDTGYPVAHGALYDSLGGDTRINGGVKVDLLLGGTPNAVEAETRRILEEVVPRSKKFILTEANNLAPCTPLDNLWAMYRAAQKYGKYK